MKDFLSDSVPFLLFFYSQVILIIVTAQLAAHNVGASMGFGVLFYLFLLPTCFLIVFLLFRYYKLRDFYIKTNYERFPDAPNHLLENVKQQHESQHIEFEQQISELEKQKQSEFNFMQQWVHQMKTPVSVMGLTMQKERLQLPEDFSHSMQEEIERLQQGLDLALYQSRLQKFDRDFHVQKITLKKLVKESIQEFKSSFIRNQVFPKLNIDEDVIIATDPKWFRFVLNQVISNAIKYSKPASEKVYFTMEHQNKSVMLQIRDTGHGIPSQDIARIFDPFFTGLNGRTFRESTGMGLYLAKEICQYLGHDINIQSEQNNGTTVSIIFQTNLTQM